LSALALATSTSIRSALLMNAGDGQAGTNGGVELVRNARQQPSQRGQLLGLHETVLRGAEIIVPAIDRRERY
jgi:hypothetical protein